MYRFSLTRSSGPRRFALDAKDLKIAIVGATGLVGQIALNLLHERHHPAENIVPMASSRSVGRRTDYGGEDLEVIEATPEAFAGIDVAFISATKEVSVQLAPEAVKRGCLVIDDSAVFRMEESVPLVVPEVNAADVLEHQGIIAIPNCTTTPLVMVLAALLPLGIIKRVIVSTYQAVSGAGARALEMFEHQLHGGSDIEGDPSSVFAFNTIPMIGALDQWGSTSEEQKIRHETAKILHREMSISATCVRVPVRVGHSEAVTIDFDAQSIFCNDVQGCLVRFPGIVVSDRPGIDKLPMPITAEGKPQVFVGRIRSNSYPGSISLFLSCDNLLKGAALNALQILDEVVARDCLKPQPKKKGRS